MKHPLCKSIVLIFLMLNFSYSESISTDSYDFPENRINQIYDRNKKVIPETITLEDATTIASNFFRYEAESINQEFENKDVTKTSIITDSTSDNLPLMYILEYGLDFYGYSYEPLRSLTSSYKSINYDLQNQYPVIISGSPNYSLNDWHIWLADGYKQFHYESWMDNGACSGDPYYGSHPYYCGVCPSCVNCTIFAATQWHMCFGQSNGNGNGWYAASPNSIAQYNTWMKAYTSIRP